MRTPQLDLPLVAAEQAQKHVTVNESLMHLDALVHLRLRAGTGGQPPSRPVESATYLVPAQATGAWADQDNNVAIARAGGWVFTSPHAGWVAYFDADGALRVFDGAQWQAINPTVGRPTTQRLLQLGINAPSSERERFSVRTESAWFSHEESDSASGDIRLKLNRKGAGNTASILFQEGWKTNGEIGLLANGSFGIRVGDSDTGLRTALRIDHRSGRVHLPQGLDEFPGSRSPALLNGDFSLWQRTHPQEIAPNSHAAIADGWFLSRGTHGAGTLRASRITMDPSAQSPPAGATFALRIDLPGGEPLGVLGQRLAIGPLLSEQALRVAFHVRGSSACMLESRLELLPPTEGLATRIFEATYTVETDRWTQVVQTFSLSPDHLRQLRTGARAELHIAAAGPHPAPSTSEPYALEFTAAQLGPTAAASVFVPEPLPILQMRAREDFTTSLSIIEGLQSAPHYPRTTLLAPHASGADAQSSTISFLQPLRKIPRVQLLDPDSRAILAPSDGLPFADSQGRTQRATFTIENVSPNGFSLRAPVDRLTAVRFHYTAEVIDQP